MKVQLTTTVQCPHCLGNKKIFNGEDYITCTYCNGAGRVSGKKANNYDPLENIEEFENNDLNMIEDDIENT